MNVKTLEYQKRLATVAAGGTEEGERLGEMLAAQGFSTEDVADTRRRAFPLGIVRAYCRRGVLTEKQWFWVDRLAQNVPKRPCGAKVGERVDITGEVYAVTDFENRWGVPVRLIKIRNDAGEHFSWYTTVGADIVEGRVEGSGTVKKHGRLETIVRRCLLRNVAEGGTMVSG